MSYTIHSKHEHIPVEKHSMQYISIDPGEYNFAARIERRYGSIVKHKCTSIKTLKQEKHVIKFGKAKKRGYSQSVSILNIIKILDGYSDYYPNTDIAIIEGQMTINTHMMHVQSVIISYFLVRYPNVVVIEQSSKLKGKALGAPRGISRTKLKKWSVETSKSLAKTRGDNTFLEYIRNQDKPDDDADAYIQIEAFCAYVGYCLS